MARPLTQEQVEELTDAEYASFLVYGVLQCTGSHQLIYSLP